MQVLLQGGLMTVCTCNTRRRRFAVRWKLAHDCNGAAQCHSSSASSGAGGASSESMWLRARAQSALREDRQNNGAPTLLNICGVPLHTGGLHVAPRAQRWRAVLAQRVQRGALSLQRGALSLHRAAVALATPRGVCMMLRSDIMAASMKIAR